MGTTLDAIPPPQGLFEDETLEKTLELATLDVDLDVGPQPEI